jgi:hypothetical protein
MKKFFVSFSVIGPDYFQFMNEEVEVETAIMSLDDILEIEDILRDALVEGELIDKEKKMMYNINILFWRPFDGSKITAGT